MQNTPPPPPPSFEFAPGIDNGPVAILAIDPDSGDILAASQAATRLYGWTSEEFQHLSVADLNQRSIETVLTFLHQAATQEKNYFELDHRFRDGQVHNVRLLSWPIENDNDTILISMVVQTDAIAQDPAAGIVNFSQTFENKIADLERTYGRLNLAFIAALAVLALTVVFLAVIVTRRRRLVRELAQQHLLLRVMMDAIPDMIFFKRADRQVVACNQAAAEFVGAPPESIIGKTDAEIFGGSQDSVLRRHVFSEVNDDENHIEQAEITSPTGKKYMLEMFKAPVIDPDGERLGSISIWRDIADRRRNEERIEALAYYDPLTRLANRAKAQDVMLSLLASHKSLNGYLALAVFDLDNFAAVNSIFGHNIGDALLRTIGRRLRNNIEPGHFAARLSSDEFLVILTDLGRDKKIARDAAHQQISRLHERLSQKAFVNSHHITPSTCVGAVLVGADAGSANDELRRADMAMHNAKAKGRGSVSWFHDEMVDELVSRFDLETALERALQTKGFRIYLQPIISRAATGRHFEVLLRLHHPERGIISPGDFIDVAESTGLIIPMGAWVLEEACKLLSEYPDLHLAVNVSMQQFLQEDFVDQLSELLQRYHFTPYHLTLEMTESMMIANFDLTLSQLRGIRDLKVRLSIDDFGTGYSALLYLKQLPLDELKIDQSFIAGVPHDSNDTSLVELIITTAHHLGLVIVAEGVETREQEEWLRRFGCESLQGFLFSRPQPVEVYLPASH